MVRERKINQKITTEVTLIMQTYFQIYLSQKTRQVYINYKEKRKLNRFCSSR